MLKTTETKNTGLYVDELEPAFVESYRTKMPPWGPVGYITYKRTYARRVSKDTTEEWFETVERCVNGIIHIGCKLTKDEAERMYDHVFNLRCSFSGRALWQLGTETVDALGGDSLQNCWACVVNDPIEPFCFTFDELMLGGGLGYNLQAEYVYEMPKVKYNVKIVRKDEKDVNFIIPDNREGWVELLRRTLTAFFFTGKGFTYSTTCVRGKGVPIKRFGGTASGPEELCEGIDRICTVLRSRVGKKLRPIDCLDIMNIIGSIVVAGNVRRSAQIALGDASDEQYLDAKRWDKGSIPKWRAMSNNSVICNIIKRLTNTFWSGYNGQGEPYGLVNLNNCRKYGRLVDGPNYRPDPRVIGTNPCGEVPLEPYESCNLAELFLPNIRSIEEFEDVAALMLKAVKTISCLPFIHEKTNEVVSRNHRLGIGVTGVLEAPELTTKEVLDRVYRRIELEDENYSKLIGVSKSIKLTTVKPSGTLSLLAGVTPGIHPAFAQYYIRRIMMATNDPLIEVCREHGFHVEPKQNLDGTINYDSMVVSFPCKPNSKAILAKDMTAIEQLEKTKHMQAYWADNSVSVTVYYKLEELDAIKDWLSKNYDDGIKTVSFLLHSGHGFVQAPYEEITKEQYESMVAKTRPINSLKDDGMSQLQSSLECSSGQCPIK
jgi:adenosylcobalamin-dependent ribonucleoside-triphosphate reductase